MAKIPMAFLHKKGGDTWPFGLDGDLVVLSGQTVDLQADTIYDYNSVDVQAGGTLRINHSGNYNTCILGVKTNMIVDGSLTRVGNGTTGGSYTKTDPLGNVFAYTITQRNGGAGGSGGYNSGASSSRRVGGSQVSGNAGGGGGTNSLNFGGTGGNGTSNGNSAVPHTLSSLGGICCYGTNGGTGLYFNTTTVSVRTGGYGGGGGGGGGGLSAYFKSASRASGGGGGGGHRNVHGLGLAIVTHGSVTGSGNISLSGGSGYGGGGGGGAATAGQGSGGGGGGGAGGSGGDFWVYHRTGFTVSYSVAGGLGGTGGAGGTFGGSGGVKGLAGSAGQAGDAGTATITTIW